MQDHLLYEPCARSHQAVELRTIGQGREGASEVACGVAVEVPLAAKAGPTGEDGEGEDLAFGEGRLGAGLPFWPMGVAEVVHHDVKCGKEGVHIDHKSSVPFPSGSGSKPTLVRGHLPLKFRWITHTTRLSRRERRFGQPTRPNPKRLFESLKDCSFQPLCRYQEAAILASLRLVARYHGSAGCLWR